MSLSNNFPTQFPTLLLDFANARRLDPRITFARNSPGVYYDGVTTAVAEQNLLVQSQSLAAGTWGVSGMTLTDNAAVAPNGTTTATRITETAVNSEHYASQTLTTFVGGAFVFSCYLKKGTLATAPDWAQLACGGTNSGYVSVNLATGVIGNTGGFTSTAIENVGSGWYRVSVSSTVAAGAISFRIGTTNNTNAATRHVTYLGSVTSDVLVWGAQVENRSTLTAYTATTTAAITNYVPVLLTAAANEARFTANPVTGVSLGLLIEEVRTNLVSYSSAFDNAYWTKLGSTITPSTNVAPDGTLTAATMTFVSGTPQFFRVLTKAASAITYTLSCYAKAYTASVFQVILSDNTTGQCTATFNLATGVVAVVTAGTWTSPSGSITPVGNGWYRCSLTGTSPANTGLLPTFVCPNAGAIFVWGAQLEEGAFATSYIATVASPQTRQADNAVMTGTNFSSWYNAGEGTIYGSYIGATQLSGATRRLVEIGNNTIDDRFVVGYSASSVSRFLVVTGGSTTADITVSGISSGTGVKMIAAYKTNDFQQVSNGTLGTADTSGTVPPVLQMHIGSDYTNAANTMLNGTVAKIAYYDSRLTNAQLQALTLT